MELQNKVAQGLWRGKHGGLNLGLLLIGSPTVEKGFN